MGGERSRTRDGRRRIVAIAARGWRDRWWFDLGIGQVLLESPALLVHSVAHFVGPPLDLALHLVGRIAYLPHGAPQCASQVRDPLRTEEQQGEEHDHQKLATADIKKKEAPHGWSKSR